MAKVIKLKTRQPGRTPDVKMRPNETVNLVATPPGEYDCFSLRAVGQYARFLQRARGVNTLNQKNRADIALRFHVKICNPKPLLCVIIA